MRTRTNWDSDGLRRLVGPRLALRRLVVPAAHIFVLSAFAVAQPLYYVFSQNAEFFAVRASKPLDIVVFALALLLLPPAALILVELLAALAGERLWRAVHLVFVAGLAAVVLLQVEKRIAVDAGASLIVLACLGGAAAAFLYERFSAARSFLTVLVPAPIIFAALFLFNSPVTKLVLLEEETTRSEPVEAETPVVFIMFDELGTVALLDAEGRVNAKRFSNFAALADDATFYRDATTVHSYTPEAVPAALTGRYPGPNELPIAADHPVNLFTLLGNGYRLRVRESITHLCPVSLCKPTTVEPLGERLTSLASDSSLVYLHVLLPERMARELPPVDQTWRDFRGMNVAVGKAKAAPPPASCAPVCTFVRRITARPPGTLYYLHAQLPHIPWRYLPSGKTYVGDTRTVPGLTDRVWEDDRFLADQAYARHLLQVGYTDRALGIILARLRETGLYDRALIVVMADHGASFLPGEPRRDPNAATLHDLAFVPLFVKLPNQASGRIEDGFVPSIDVLPTIADALGVDVPGQVDGRSLVGRTPPADGVVRVQAQDGEPFEAQLSKLVAERAEELRRWTGLFGDGDWSGIYRGGPHGDLVGRPLEDLDVGEADGLSVELDQQPLFAAYDPDGPLSPAWATGRIKGADPGLDLAVAVNGVVAATTQVYDASGEPSFAVFVPESMLEAGANDVELFTVTSSGALDRIPPAAPELALEDGTIRRAGGSELRLDADAVHGTVDAAANGDSVVFSGWAVDDARNRPVESVAVFVDGRLVYVARGETLRTPEPEQHEGIDDSAFRFALPANLLPAAGSAADVRVFAVGGDAAGELRYEPGYPWGNASR